VTGAVFMKKFLIGILCVLLSTQPVLAKEYEVEISAPAAILMEASTGKIVYEKNADEKRPPASVTKVIHSGLGISI
jgi:D-alanyl-D-alanine carboxypeptidase (penicillin-binding protein 5/6)